MTLTFLPSLVGSVDHDVVVEHSEDDDADVGEGCRNWKQSSGFIQQENYLSTVFAGKAWVVWKRKIYGAVSIAWTQVIAGDLVAIKHTKVASR